MFMFPNFFAEIPAILPLHSGINIFQLRGKYS